MATVATLTFDLVAQSASLRSELGKANRHTKTWADKTRKMVNTSAKAFAGLSVAGVASLAAIYTQAANSADQLGKFSDKVGEAPEKIQGLHRAAQLTGVSVETANMALQRMTRRTSEAAQSTGEAVNAIKELGLDAKELAKLSPADQFSKISDAMKDVKTQGDRVRLAMKLFDSEGVALVNTLDLGSQGLADITKEVDEYGLALTRVDIAKIEAANDSWFRATEITKGFGNRLAIELSPLVEALSNNLLNAAKEAGGLGEVATAAISATLKPFTVVADAVRAFHIAILGVDKVIIGMASTAIQSFGLIAKGYIEIANLLGSEVTYEDTIFGQAEEFANTAYDAISEKLNSVLMEKIPSHQVEEWVADVQSKATKAAEKVAEGKKFSSIVMPEGLPGGSSPEGDSPLVPTKENLKSFKSVMEEYGEVSANSADHIEDSFSSAFDSMTSNLSTGLASAIVEGESLKDTLGNVAKTMAVDMVGGLIKVGAQMLVNAAFGKATQAEAVGSSIIAGNAIAAAYSTAAAFTSLASFGANGPPAQAAIGSTVGFSKALSLTGMAHDGISEVPKEGTWLLDKGERVLSSKQNDDLGSFMKEDQGGSVEVTNIFQISAGVSGTVKSEIEKLLPAFERLSVMSVEKAIKGGGSLARAVGAR